MDSLVQKGVHNMFYFHFKIFFQSLVLIHFFYLLELYHDF